jgi:DNA (cytosine-5)-methyltransferase 1
LIKDEMLTFGSLFSGIGGIDLGFEWAGMQCVWQVEIDDYCNDVLAKHWPNVARYRDVKEVHGIMAHATGTRRAENGNKEFRRQKGADVKVASCPSCLPPVDVITGGFPCQPHSVAGKRRGAADDRNLWPEYLRIITDLKPAWVVGENVPGIVTTYLDTVLSDLGGAGYEVATFEIPAVAFDAKHLRYRIFVVAHTIGEQSEWRNNGSEWGQRSQEESTRHGRPRGGVEDDRWPVEPSVDRVAYGVSNRVDRLRGLGNAVVPQVAEFIGSLIVAASNEVNA